MSGKRSGKFRLILPAVLFQRPVGKDLIPFSPLSAQGALAYLQFTE